MDNDATISSRTFCIPVSYPEVQDEKKEQENGETCTVKSFTSFTPHCYYSGDQTKQDKMVGACDTYGREVKCIDLVGKPGGRIEMRERRWENNYNES